SHRQSVRHKIEDLVKPVEVPIPKIEDSEGVNTVGFVEETGLLVSEEAKSMVLDEFRTRPLVRELAEENGLNERLFIEAYSFRNYCRNAKPLDPAIFVIISDIFLGHSVDSLFPYFLAHARKVFPHLECIDDLRRISDLTQPHNWYAEARKLFRKVVFHAGPTNSGKTHEAVQRFFNAKNGIYCAPLRLLAAEIFLKSNKAGIYVKCDLVTGEERRYATSISSPSDHVSCTVEMLPTDKVYDVAVIDEIQMLRDEQRGWAWTRALLGVAAKEVHLCGEASAIDIVKKLLDETGEHVEVRNYDRMSKLDIRNHALGSLDKLQDGDCIVCFNKAKIFGLTRELDRLGIKFAVIYGDLPPGTKLAQAAKFNDLSDPTNVLVTTDAIGMGMNLNIRRIIFASLTKMGKFIPNYHALQIAGRAGRYGTQYEDGEVLALNEGDSLKLCQLLSEPIEPIKQVGISPTFEQVETFAYHLPKATFCDLLDIFVSVCSINDRFFICTSVEHMKALAQFIEHVSLPLQVRYYFCISPLDPEEHFQGQFLLKLARRFSQGQALDFEWLCYAIGWPPRPLGRLTDLFHLEQMHAVLDAYLWLSFRFQDMMPAEHEALDLKEQIDTMIQDGLERIVELYASHNAKSDGIRKKIDERTRVAEEKRTISESLVARGLLSASQLEQLKAELRQEEIRKLRLRK
ncbi:unnamed protein product, partial [Enterobius vermicularis]|uniref:ATP-dependent RNA helicase SUV3 homolog, mitochondrial n=1 Tax=Enterobius vermicularis TaxID=51028 RepID=A0A0N4VF24_ENTVE